MNYIFSVVSPKAVEELVQIHREISVPLFVTLLGRGTAVQSMLDLLGIDSNEKRIVMAVANTEKTEKLLSEIKNRLYIGIPGHGIVFSIPVKSIGGGSAVHVLSQGETPAKTGPELSRTFELIVAIVNEGRTDIVMNAARSAGATGGTVLHGKGTAAEETARFLNVSLADEKEIIFIIARQEHKAGIMRAVLEKAGPHTEAGTVLFSTPVSSVAGFGMFEES